MKAFLKIAIGIIFLAIVLPAGAQLVTNQPARFQMKVVCYDGKIGSSSFSTSIAPTPEGIAPGNETRNTVTTPGHESELSWVFVGRNKDKDVYHFTFMRNTKPDGLSKTTTSRNFLFDGQRTVIFEDDLHAVVVESPSTEDLKNVGQAQR